MTEGSKPVWERWGDALIGRCGYIFLALATPLGLFLGPPDIQWQVTTLAIAAAAAVWIYLLYTRMPLPRLEPRWRVLVFFVGVLAFASILMLRQPVFFIFMISGFFYAYLLKPLPLAVAGVAATSILVNTLISGLPENPGGWVFYLAIIGVQIVAIGGGVIVGERISEQNEERRRTVAQLEAALVENAGLQAQLLTQAREAGVLDERARMAAEIHDTIAQGLMGIVTQLEAARLASDERPTDRDRHIDNAQRLARDSLAEARRAVEASRPAALESTSLPDALAAVAKDWSELNGIPVETRVTGDVTALHPDIEFALLRTAQEALANVARHADASRAGITLSYMRDVVTLDVRDDGVGFNVPEPGSAAGGAGFGLTAMRRRIARVAGSLAIESEPGGGTALSATVPLVEDNAVTAVTPVASQAS